MRTKATLSTLVLAFVVTTISLSGQEAHPVVGTWTGSWGPSPDHQNYVVLVLDWDGNELTGTINPGLENVRLSAATLDPSDWTVRFEADASTPAGAPVHYVIDGRIEDLGSPNRSIVGTWTHDSIQGEFRITRR